jgi:hypothetical protein
LKLKSCNPTNPCWWISGLRGALLVGWSRLCWKRPPLYLRAARAVAVAVVSQCGFARPRISERARSDDAEQVSLKKTRDVENCVIPGARLVALTQITFKGYENDRKNLYRGNLANKLLDDNRT